MNPRRWILAMAVVAAGCGLVTEAPTTTSPTTTTLAVAAIINLGGDPSDIEYCLGHAMPVVNAGEELGLMDIPWRTQEYNAWVAEHPNEFTSACALANLSENANEVAERVKVRFEAKAGRVIEEGLADTERVWCFENGLDVVQAADVLGVGPNDVLPGLLQAPSSIIGGLDERDSWVMWLALAPDAYVRGCRAAFDLR